MTTLFIRSSIVLVTVEVVIVLWMKVIHGFVCNNFHFKIFCNYDSVYIQRLLLQYLCGVDIDMRLFPDFHFIVHKSALIMLAFTTLVNIRRREDYQLAGACGSITPHATQRNLCCTVYTTVHSACTSTVHVVLLPLQVVTRVAVTIVQYNCIIPYFLFTSSKLRFTFIVNMIL